MSTHPVVFEAFGVECSLTVEEARNLMIRIGTAIAKLRVKCPTCRCNVVPGDACHCCDDVEVDDEERAEGRR